MTRKFAEFICETESIREEFINSIKTLDPEVSVIEITDKTGIRFSNNLHVKIDSDALMFLRLKYPKIYESMKVFSIPDNLKNQYRRK